MNRDSDQRQDPGSLASLVQGRAAHPLDSVVLRASAGSGKTKVLVDRFLRLCLDGESFQADPRSILAVTFTRKAAVEIQERLLDKTRVLALATEEKLRQELAHLLGRSEAKITDREMAAAGGLHEKLLEDLSGLNVGTIHSFCQSILNRFAAEAGLAPNAGILEDTTDLLEEALDLLDTRISLEKDLQEAARQVAQEPGAVRSAVRKAYGQRLHLQRWAAQAGENLSASEMTSCLAGDLRAELLAELDLPPGDPRTTLPEAMRAALQKYLDDSSPRILAGLPAGISKKHADNLKDKLEKILAGVQALLDRWPGEFSADFLGELKGVFLNKKGEPRSHSRLPDLKEIFNGRVVSEAVPLLALTRYWSYLDLLDLNTGLLRLTLELVDITRALKAREQAIDFQDLEETACRLMGDPARALSLLYRLDDSINHILLDEFQDTNRNQWELMEPFVEEFLAGGSDPDRRRTVFLVGDVKQSIYRFRGAEPGLFHEVSELMRRQEQKEYTLPTNFRSLAAVVESVGCVFTRPPLRELLPRGEAEKVTQAVFRQKPFGTVTVLEPCQGDDGGDDARTADQVAAETVAREAARLVASGNVSWNDILVLARSRTEMGLYEKAFRDRGIPIVSGGRGTLASGREVQDILALLRWLTYPQDDVALATVLRSPLLRVAEKDFQQLLANRGLDRQDSQGRKLPPQGLWQTLRRKKDEPLWADTIALLRSWRGKLGQESCHSLLRRIYRDAHVLDRYQVAAGDQARHNLLRLFDLALAPEVAATPTVRQLIAVIDRAARLQAEEEAVAPPAENLGRVRFMTIHGAKGLEAPVVFLVDADRKLGKESHQILLRPDDPHSPLLQKVNKEISHRMAVEDLPASGLEIAADKARQSEATEDANLLYVAMTRARDHLYIMGGEKKGDPSFLSQLQAAAADGDCQHIRRNLDPEEDPGSVQAQAQKASPGEDVVCWQPPTLEPEVRTVTPSAVEEEAGGVESGSSNRGETDRRAAIRRGDRIHLLLQQAADLGAMPPGTDSCHQEAARVFANPDLDWIFHPASQVARGLSEAPIIQRKSGQDGAAEERVTGIIDRLILRDGRVDIIDYKTNRVGTGQGEVPALVDHYRPQLNAYREALAVLYPEAMIRTWLLFTDPAAGPGGLLQEVQEK